ncbi:MAG: hypothetical protein CBC76_00050 [Flavobacteriaceae bacterium TMED116]|nr:MAG: hypothetical protein CBC76_00050 [Flavobacteriaceae bacterium TMED116]
MKNTLVLIILFFINCSQVKVVSYNIRYKSSNEDINSWDNRKYYVSKFLLNESPDFIGLQEVTNSQLQDLLKSLVNYSYIGVGRDDGIDKGEFSPVFFNKKKFKVLFQDTFWLSDTPEKVSIGWDASMERICTYGLFEEIFSKKRIWFFNTHFDHIGNVARKKSMDLIIQKINKVNSEDIPLIITGDFNLEDDNFSIKKIQKQFTDVLFGIKKSDKLYSTFNNFNSRVISGKRIDYIFIKNLKNIKSTHVHLKTSSKNWASDHHPVLSELKF